MFTRGFAAASLAAALWAPAAAWAGMLPEEVSAERAEIRDHVRDTLARLYAAQPAARNVIARAAGYAVMDTFGVKVFVAGGGTGKGIAFDKAGHQTFMKMIEVQAGLGMGVQKLSQIWVFATRAGLAHFISGSFELSGSADAGARYGKEGLSIAGAIPISQGVWLYQLQGDGLAAELTAKGTKYYRYDELN